MSQTVPADALLKPVAPSVEAACRQSARNRPAGAFQMECAATIGNPDGSRIQTMENTRTVVKMPLWMACMVMGAQRDPRHSRAKEKAIPSEQSTGMK